MAGLPQLVKELRRRRVFRVAGIYIVAAWVAVQAFSEVFPALEIPAEAIRFVWIGAILGFPLALMFGWFYDLTPTGIVRTPPAEYDDDQELVLRPLDYTILAALLIIAIGIAYQQSLQISQTSTITVQQTAIDIDPMSIAVLPLENLSGDPEQAYFVNGMHDALITELSRISGLRVTSRTSTLGFANTDLRMPDIGRELGVEKIIEGSVYRVDGRVRIVVQLIDAAVDEHLWSESYERDITDVLRLQSDITREIADQVQVVLTADESHSLTRAGTVDPESYEAYLRGMFHVELFTPEDMRLAVRHFETAVELDPLNTFIQALHGVQMTMIGQDEKGLAEISAALETTPGLGFGYDVIWYINARRGRLDESFDAARKHFGITVGNQAAVDALDRGYATGGYQQAMLTAAAELAERSKTSYIPAMEISMLYEIGGDFDTAMDWLDIAYDQHDPSLPYIGALPLFVTSHPRYDDLLRRMNLSQWIVE